MVDVGNALDPYVPCVTTAMHFDPAAIASVSAPTAFAVALPQVMGDAQALTRLVAGDESALSDIYDRHSAAVLGLAVRMMNDRSLAEDIVQETFVGLWKHAARFDPERASLRTWILVIARNRAIDHIRRRRMATVSLDNDNGIADAVSPAPDVWPAVAERLDAEIVKRALASLPEVQRRSIELAYFGGMTQHEIAAVTGVPLGTVKSRVRLGLRRLRELLALDLEDDFAGKAA